MFPLTLQSAVLRKAGKRLIGPVDLTLHKQGPIMIIGPNGSGKTSLLRMMHGIERLAEGECRWSMSAEDAQRRQAFVFQTPILMRRDVFGNLAYPLRLHNQSRSKIDQEVHDWARRVGLSEMLYRPARALSGGERQKMALARALIARPEVLFLDEPCAALDGRATSEIEALLHEVAQQGTQVIMSTHNMGQAKRLADFIVFLVAGLVEEASSAKAFFDNPDSPKSAAFLNGDLIA